MQPSNKQTRRPNFNPPKKSPFTLNKNLLQQLFNNRKDSSFRAAFDFFQSTHSFAPTKMIGNEQRNNLDHFRKVRDNQYHTLRLYDTRIFSSFSNQKVLSPSKRESLASLRKKSIGILNAKSLAPTSSSYKVRKIERRRVGRISSDGTPVVGPRKSTGFSRIENIKCRVFKSFNPIQTKYSKYSEFQEEQLTGWNIKSVHLQADTQV